MTAHTTTNSGEVQVYNLDHTRTPGNMKVRWRVRIATGKDAERLEKLQNQAIINLLTWADQYLTQQEQNTAPGTETEPERCNETTGIVTLNVTPRK
jgi:hypothetical protein